jgi:hypothetical protein
VLADAACAVLEAELGKDASARRAFAGWQKLRDDAPPSEPPAARSPRTVERAA